MHVEIKQYTIKNSQLSKSCQDNLQKKTDDIKMKKLRGQVKWQNRYS